MKSRRRPFVVLTIAALALGLLAAVASAGIHLPAPKSGVWKFETPGGGSMALKKKGKKLSVTGIHAMTQAYVGCPDKPVKIEVLGKLPLKLIPLTKYPGYSAWGVGKKTKKGDEENPGVAPIPAKVKVDGKPAKDGALKLEFSAAEANTFVALWIEYEGTNQTCVTPIEYAKHK